MTNIKSKMENGKWTWRTMKGSVLNLLYGAGAFAPFRWASRGQALILTYHRFGERQGEAPSSARPFGEQVIYLAADYTLAPLSRSAEGWRTPDGPARLAATAGCAGH